MGMIRASERPSSRIDTKTICEVPLQAAVDWTNSSSEVVRFFFSPGAPHLDFEMWDNSPSPRSLAGMLFWFLRHLARPLLSAV